MYSYIDAKYTQFIGATGADVSAQRVFQNTPRNSRQYPSNL